MKVVIHSALGASRRARDTLDGAALEVSLARPSEAPEWLPSFHMSQVRATAGIAYIDFGDGQRAVNELQAALGGIKSHSLHRSLILAYASEAYAMIREPEHSTALLRQAVPAASESRSVLRTARIRRARRALEPWDREPFVTELDGQLAIAGLRET